MSPQNKWQEAIRRATQETADALAEVNAQHPFPRYPLRKRIFWRLRGVPAKVRAEEHALGKARAQHFVAALQRHHRRAA